MNVGRSRTLGLRCLVSVCALSGITAAAAPIPSPERNGIVEIGGDIPIRHWDAPRFFQPPAVTVAGESASPVSPNAVSSTPLIFVAVTPCRIVDTRHSAPIAGGSARTFTLTGGTCAVPAGALAFSLNLTVVSSIPYVDGFLTAFPTGTTRPIVSTLNYGSIVANAAIVPATNGQIDVYLNQTANVLIDVNGYYTTDPMTGPYVHYKTYLFNQPVPNMTMTRLDFEALVAESSDATGAVYTVSGGWKFTAPKDGVYNVTVERVFAGQTLSKNTWTALQLWKNGYQVGPFGGTVLPAGTISDISAHGTRDVELIVGDEIWVTYYQNSGASFASAVSPSTNQISIKYVRPLP